MSPYYRGLALCGSQKIATVEPSSAGRHRFNRMFSSRSGVVSLMAWQSIDLRVHTFEITSKFHRTHQVRTPEQPLQ